MKKDSFSHRWETTFDGFDCVRGKRCFKAWSEHTDWNWTSPPLSKRDYVMQVVGRAHCDQSHILLFLLFRFLIIWLALPRISNLKSTLERWRTFVSYNHRKSLAGLRRERGFLTDLRENSMVTKKTHETDESHATRMKIWVDLARIPKRGLWKKK